MIAQGEDTTWHLNLLRKPIHCLCVRTCKDCAKAVLRKEPGQRDLPAQRKSSEAFSFNGATTFHGQYHSFFSIGNLLPIVSINNRSEQATVTMNGFNCCQWCRASNCARFIQLLCIDSFSNFCRSLQWTSISSPVRLIDLSNYFDCCFRRPIVKWSSSIALFQTFVKDTDRCPSLRFGGDNQRLHSLSVELFQLGLWKTSMICMMVHVSPIQTLIDDSICCTHNTSNPYWFRSKSICFKQIVSSVKLIAPLAADRFTSDSSTPA